jgi:hypothetical protein
MKTYLVFLNLKPNILFFKNSTPMKTPFNKFLYLGFIVLGAYQAIFTQDYVQAASSLGIGMAFDPFDQDQKWNDRPTWQKAVLFIHLGIVAALFGFGVGMNDR